MPKPFDPYRSWRKIFPQEYEKCVYYQEYIEKVYKPSSLGCLENVPDRRNKCKFCPYSMGIY